MSYWLDEASQAYADVLADHQRNINQLMADIYGQLLKGRGYPSLLLVSPDEWRIMNAASQAPASCLPGCSPRGGHVSGCPLGGKLCGVCNTANGHRAGCPQGPNQRAQPGAPGVPYCCDNCGSTGTTTAFWRGVKVPNMARSLFFCSQTCEQMYMAQYISAAPRTPAPAVQCQNCMGGCSNPVVQQVNGQSYSFCSASCFTAWYSAYVTKRPPNQPQPQTLTPTVPMSQAVCAQCGHVIGGLPCLAGGKTFCDQDCWQRYAQYNQPRMKSQHPYDYEIGDIDLLEDA